MRHTDTDFDPELERLEHLSNGVLDLIAAGRLDEAEQSCRELQRDFPEQMDWMERTAELHEARGESGQAIEHYERCIAFIRENADGFEPDSEDWYREKVALLRSSQGVP